MSRIVISFSDRGREYLFRALTIIELLSERHELLCIVPGSVARRTTELCRGLSNVELFSIPEANWTARIAATRDSVSTVPSWTKLSLIENKVQRFAPDLLITVSESLLPRIGKRLGVSCMRIDSPDVFDDLELLEIPLASRIPRLVKDFARSALESNTDKHVVSSYHHLSQPARLPSRRAYHRVGVLLRKELQSDCSEQPHLLVKLAEQNKHWLNELVKLNLPARVYGLPISERVGRIELRDSPRAFAEDFLSCCGVVTDLGNQLIGEALVCGKHVLAIPNPGDYHQRVGAYVLSKYDLASPRLAPRLTAELLERFYHDNKPSLAAAMVVPVANEEVRSLIETELQQT